MKIKLLLFCLSGLLLLSVSVTNATAQPVSPARKANPGPRHFTVVDATPGESLLSVPFYFAPGEIKEAAAFDCTSDSTRFKVQARVLSRHPRDNSVRAVMLRGVTPDLKSGQRVNIKPIAANDKPLLTVGDKRAEFSADARRVVLEDNVVTVYRGATIETTVAPLAPSFPSGYYGPRIHVVENGPQFAWIRCEYTGYPWNVTLEIQADKLGQINFISRILAVNSEQPFPEFGFTGRLASGARGVNGVSEAAMSLRLRNDARRINTFSSGATSYLFPDGAHVRQGRLEIEGDSFRLFRDPALDNLNKPRYVFLEGQERSFKLALAAPGQSTLKHATGEVAAARRAAVVMKAAPSDWSDLSPMRKAVASLAPRLQSLDGDDWGDITSLVNRDSPVYVPAQHTRLDQGLSWLEDYYYGGDRVLRDVPIRWAENYLERHLYRGWDLNAYGGERYAITAENNIPNYNQKGLFLLMHTYEETGDDRYREAGLAAADRAEKFMRTRTFLPSYDLPTGFWPDNNTRTTYFAIDLIKFYEYSGDSKYLQAAQRIMDGLDEMRQRTASSPELTTNYHTGHKTVALLAEGVSDPYSLGWLGLRGDDTGIEITPGGFPKPFILNYHLRGASTTFAATGSPAARSLMVHTADYLADKRNVMGTWSYAQTNSPPNITIVPSLLGGALLQAYQQTGNKKYLDVAVEQAKLMVQLHQVTGDLSFGFSMGGGKPYFYAEDVTPSDVRRGSLSSGTVGRDSLAHFFDMMNQYFQLFPAQTARLKEPLQNETARWMVEKAPLPGNSQRPANPTATEYAAAVAAEPTTAFEETLGNGSFTHEGGNSYYYRLRTESISDAGGGTSTLQLFENGKALEPAHSPHSEIRATGRGRWSHWGAYGNRVIYMSASDNSDPRTNGRTYTVKQPASGTPDKAVAAWEAYLQKYPDSPFEYLRLATLVAGTPAETEHLTKFVMAFPKHLRSGTARLRLYRQTGNVKWLHEITSNLPNSIWAREAQALLWANGAGPRPEHLVANDGVSVSSFRESRELKPAPNPTEVTVRREGDALVLHIIGHNWKQREWKEGAPGPAALHLYFDASEDHERWTRFEIDADSANRRYQPPTWPGMSVSPIANEDDWSVKQTRRGDELTFDVRIPLAKLNVTGPANGSIVMGFDVVRIEPDTWSFWSRTMNSYNVFTGDFGRLVLK